MRRKRPSPTKLQAAASMKSDTELKTSFFSKSRWVRKGKNDEDKKADGKKKSENIPNSGLLEEEAISDDEEESEEESSVDIEMPPFLTKSKPLLLQKGDGRKLNSGEVSKSTIKSIDEDDNSSEEEFPGNDTMITRMKYQSTESLKQLQPHEGKQHQNQRQETAPDPSQQQPRMINELKDKFRHDRAESYLSPRKTLSEEGSLNHRTKKPDSIISPSKKPAYKGPNFFVNDSPVKAFFSENATKRTKADPFVTTTTSVNKSQPIGGTQFHQVTSNGWSSTNSNASTFLANKESSVRGSIERINDSERRTISATKEGKHEIKAFPSTSYKLVFRI
jgi:hypothetical protein